MYKIIQCRSVEGYPEVCNQVDETNRIKEARGLLKMQFNSHIDNLYRHEMYVYWDRWELDEDKLTFVAYDGNRVIYSYRVVMERQMTNAQVLEALKLNLNKCKKRELGFFDYSSGLHDISDNEINNQVRGIIEKTWDKAIREIDKMMEEVGE